MIVRFRLLDHLRAVVLLFALSFGLAAAFPGSVSPASAQDVSVEFRTALDPYGSWRNHSRWGEVWIPSDRGRDWRPYTVGRWTYTDDYGWYWRAADREAAWGSIVYHYGRWVLDAELGWVWVPGNVWAPAWVSWRRGEPPRGDHRHVVGWAPLPPDEIVVSIRDEPRYWAFVPARQLVAAELIASVVLPPQPVFIQETVIVHRTVVVRKGGATFAVGAGISPDYVALAWGRPIPSYRVRPVVLAGTMAPPNAVTIRAEQYREFRDRRGRPDQLRVEMREARQIQPARSVEPPQALAERERVNPETLPNAAKGAEIVSAPATREGATTGAAKDAKGQPVQETGRQTDQQRSKDAAGDASKDAAKGATKDATRDTAKDAARDAKDTKGAARDAKEAADPSQKDAADRSKQGKDASKDAKRQRDAAEQPATDAEDRSKRAKDAAKDDRQDAADKAQSKDSRAGKDASREDRRDARQERGRDGRQGAAKDDGDAGQKDASEARDRQKGQRESRSEREPKASRDDAARSRGSDAAERGPRGDAKRATGRDAAPDRPTVGRSGGREPAAAPRQAIERGSDQGARGGGSRTEAPAAATTGRAPAAAAPRGAAGGPARAAGGGGGGPKGGDARN